MGKRRRPKTGPRPQRLSEFFVDENGSVGRGEHIPCILRDAQVP